MWIVLIGIVAVVFGVLAREFWKLWLPLAVANSAQARGRKDAACRIYRRVIATPTLMSDAVRHDARYRLSWLLMEKGQYAEAVELLQTNLQKRLAPAVEANTRQRLAEALEGAGQKAQAARERAQAGELLANAPDSAAKLLSEADMLSKQQKFAEAYATYERAMALIPPANSAVRARVMVQLSLSAFNNGQPQQAARWGEQAIALQPELTLLMTAHSTAGLGYSALGQLEQAEAHRVWAMEIATQAGNRDMAARYMVQVAETRRRMGKLTEAMQMCEQAAGMSISERRMVYAVQFEILCNWGRFEEAAQVLEQAQRAQKFPTPSAQKRMQAAHDCETAMLLGERNLPEQALQRLAQGLEGLRNDTKTSARYESGGIWLRAMLGQREEVMAQAADMEARIGEFNQDPATQRTLVGNLGRAFDVLGEYTRSLEYWKRYLALAPDPLYLPKGYYYAGHGLYQLGNTQEAEAMLANALASGIDTIDAQRARRLLHELNAPMQTTAAP